MLSGAANGVFSIYRMAIEEMGPDQTVIRELQRKDCPAVAGLWRELLDEPSATDESVLKTFEKMRRDSRYCTYVAEEDGTIIGFITFVEVLAFDAPDGYIKINGLAVLPEYRRRGIGLALVARAEEEASKRGASSLGVASLFKRTGAHAFYESIGYQGSAFWFRKYLNG